MKVCDHLAGRETYNERGCTNGSGEVHVVAKLVTYFHRAVLDLPGLEQAKERQLPTTKLIPMAAEFENGDIDPLYIELIKRLGGGTSEPPKKPANTDIDEDVRNNYWREYWGWFNDKFNAQKAIEVIEEAAGGARRRIRWIAYRAPMGVEDSPPLHLHISPAGNYDTGVFAYNFIKRGYKHGVRLVGTLKSEPDMNVLAIYEK